MEITRKNYEAFFVDYLEGNLDETLVDVFIEFLQQNPDLKEELDLFKEVSAAPEIIAFHKKDKLYKDKYDLESEFNNAVIASLEGDISKKEKTEFELYLDVHPEKQKDAALFSRTILKAGENIHFEKKQKLYKKTGRRIVLMWTGRVAAVLILGLAIFSLMENRKNTNAPIDRVAEVKKEAPQNEAVKENKIGEEELIPLLEPSDKTTAELPTSRKKIEVQKTVKSRSSLPETEPADESLLAKREPVEIPQAMNTLNATFEAGVTTATLAAMNPALPVDEEPVQDEWLISDEIREKINLKNIGRAGLNLVANISNDRFQFKTDQQGNVTEYSYDSKFLAFSIPVTTANPE